MKFSKWVRSQRFQMMATVERSIPFACLVLLWFKPDWMLLMWTQYYALAAIVLFCWLTPLGNAKIATLSPARLPFGVWVCLLAASFGIYLLISLSLLDTLIYGGAPLFIPESEFVHVVEVAWAYFPQFLLACFTYNAIITYAAQKELSPSYASLSQYVRPKALVGWLSHARINLAYSSNGVLLSVVMTAGIILVANYFIEALEMTPWSAVPFLAATGFVLFAPLFANPKLTKQMFRAMSKWVAPFSLLYLITGIGAVVILIAVSQVAHELLTSLGPLPMPIVEVVQQIFDNAANKDKRLLLMIYGWFSLSVPLMGSLWARLSQQYSLRAQAFTLFSLLCFILYPEYSVEIDLPKVAASIQQRPVTFGFALFIVPMLILRHYRQMDIYILGFMKSKRLSIKSHGFALKARFIPLSICGFLQAMAMTGWYGLQTFICMVASALYLDLFIQAVFLIFLILQTMRLQIKPFISTTKAGG